MLLILGHQEVKKSKNLITNLSEKEVENFVFATHDFARIVKNEANPFIILVNAKSIEELLIAKCRLGENTFLQEADGQEVVLNSYGDAGIIQYELSRGGKIMPADEASEINYFKHEALPTFKSLSFSIWQIIWYFSRQMFLIIFFTFLPFFLTLKLFIFALSILIFIPILLSMRRFINAEKPGEKIVKEYCLKKIPPNLNVKTMTLNDSISTHDFMIMQVDAKTPLPENKLIFPYLLDGEIREALRKIFHIPIYCFVMNDIKGFNHLTKQYLKWKKKVNMRPMNYWGNCQMHYENYGLRSLVIVI